MFSRAGSDPDTAQTYTPNSDVSVFAFLPPPADTFGFGLRDGRAHGVSHARVVASGGFEEDGSSMRSKELCEFESSQEYDAAVSKGAGLLGQCAHVCMCASACKITDVDTCILLAGKADARHQNPSLHCNLLRPEQRRRTPQHASPDMPESAPGRCEALVSTFEGGLSRVRWALTALPRPAEQKTLNQQPCFCDRAHPSLGPGLRLEFGL